MASGRNTQLTRQIGEYLAAAELGRRNWVPQLLPVASPDLTFSRSTTKKRVLDEFVEDFKARRAEGEASVLEAATADVLSALVELFEEQDPLLQRIGMLTLYYELGRELIAGQLTHTDLTRERLASFEAARAHNRANERFRRILLERHDDEAGSVQVDARLSAFDRQLQSTNDGGSMKERYHLLREYLVGAVEFFHTSDG